jgi:lysine-specific demethylase/histidyl-hydroxylase NO66
MGSAEMSAGPVLATLVGDVATFSESAWGREVHLATTKHRIMDLLGIDDVLNLVASGGMRLPDVRMMNDGEPIPAEHFSRSAQLGRNVTEGLIEPDLVAGLMSEGATLILQGMRRYWAPLDGLCRRLDQELGQTTQAGAFLTPAECVGAPNHYDYFDAFVCQTEGTKHWLYGCAPGVVPLQPWRHGTPPADPGFTAVTLRPGDTLYLPRGTFHQAQAAEEVSLHVTIRVVQPFTFRTLLEAALEHLLGPSLEQPLPVGHFTLPIDDVVETILSPILNLTTPELLDSLSMAVRRGRDDLERNFDQETARASSGIALLLQAIRSVGDRRK